MSALAKPSAYPFVHFSHLDNAHISQSRLILLDATLIFFLSLTMYSYIRFRKLRYLYVSRPWTVLGHT
jgi:dolichyl-phosphate-mannose--protein O-mannosyl transferase